MSDVSLASCRVVLVRTHIAGNLGATARVMRNLGFTDLVLVDPLANRFDREARQLSTHGEEILDRARVVSDLGEAVADCVLVAATSARIEGRLRTQSLGTPDEVLPRVADALAAGPVALVFGPEPSGLTNEEITRCHWLIHIPTDPTYPALNLAQAVAICLYELRRIWRARAPAAPREPPAPFADQERMFELLRQGLTDLGYLFGDRADALMHAVRHLIGRAGPTAQEVRILIGLARQLEWYVRNHPPAPGQQTMDRPPDESG
jgi:tRNA/rRNA methyltransferase